MSTGETYKFQKQEKKFIAGRETWMKSDAVTFCKHLGFEFDNCPLSVKREIELYIIKVHCNILYYVNKIQDERALIIRYVIFTGILAVAIPIVTFVMPLPFMNAEKAISGVAYAAIIPAQITAVLTGLFALHKIVTLWIFRRNSIHAFWKASCQLKSLLYSFEDKWKGNLGDGPSLEFLRELRESRKEAETIIEQEEGSFFQSYDKTSVDLQGLIKSASNDATAVAGSIADPMFKELAERERRQTQREDELRKAREDLVMASAEVRVLEQRVVALEYRREHSRDADARTVVAAELTAVQGQLEKARTKLQTVTAAYEAKKSSEAAAPVAA